VPAGAQQTPATYCKTLAAVSCEVLNVEPVGMAAVSNPNTGTTESYATFLVKQCRNQNFETRVVYFTAYANGGSFPDPFSGTAYIGTLTGGASSGTLFAGRTMTAGRANTDLAMACF